MAELMQLARRRIGGVLLPAVLTGALGVMAGSLLPAKYTATTIMELATVPQPLVEAGLDQNRLRDRMAAAERVLKTEKHMNEVLTTLEWEHYETLPPDERREFIKKLNKDLWIHVDNQDGTGLHFMEFGYRDTDPQRAAQFANELRDYFVRELIEDARRESSEQLDLLNEQFTIAEEGFEAAILRLEDLRKEHKISPTQSFGSSATERETDPLYVELQAANAELGTLGKAIETDEAGLLALRKRRESLPEQISEVEAEIGGIEMTERKQDLLELIQVEQQSKVGKKPAHSGYQKAEEKIREYERQLAQLEGRSVDPTQVVNKVPNPERNEVDKEIATLEMTLARNRALLTVVQRTIGELEPKFADRIQIYSEFQKETDNFEQVRTRRNSLFNLLEIKRGLVANLSLPDFSPFDVHQEALPPTKPSSPSALFVVAGGLVLGLALGLLYALVAEFGRNAYRSPGDLARALPAPVLGAINEIVTLRERRQRSFRSGLVGAATLILAGSVLWITWAFHTSPGLLGPELTSWLDEMRGQLR
jgi:uncharacterized protein involved in exopolysaccharide biosynthesis